MPWNAASFKSRHNHGLSTADAGKAADQANAILRKTGDEGLAISVANKHAKSRSARMYGKKAVRGYAEGGEVDPANDNFGAKALTPDQFDARLKEVLSKIPPGGTRKPKDDGKASGGQIKRVTGKPVGKDDGMIPAQKGEYVIRKSAVQKLGTGVMDKINEGHLPSGAAIAHATHSSKLYGAKKVRHG
ncbi:MAG TPA: hypothetical protein VNU19_24200 [Candidatus Acidoferrum sp.]|jgi:hypothetical protein|nr:hypothetical protein [Candidatus Acidoferrum sp.]